MYLLLAWIAGATVRAESPGGEAPFPAGPGVNEIGITCAPQPVEAGLRFDRAGTHAATVAIQGKTYDAWLADKSVTKNAGWMKSFRLQVADPRFQKGGRPVVELEVTCYVAKPGTIIIRADTATGNRQVGHFWHKGGGWETFRVRFDDAFFGARSVDGAEPFSMDGFDLRIDSSGNDLYLQKVRLAGYDTERDVLWPKLLNVADGSTHGPGGVLVWPRQAGQKFEIILQNHSRLPADFQYRVQMTGRDGVARFSRQGPLAIPPSSGLTLPLDIDPGGWPLGPYEIGFEVTARDRPGQVLFARRFRAGVIDGAVLDKARAGEFLYGLDAANNSIHPTHTPAAFAYYRLMGVDILRNPYDKGMRETTDDLGRALASLAAEGLQSALMIDPPHDADPGKLQAQLEKKNAFVEQAARLFAGRGPGKLRYFELGNEPDLPRFYPGPISDYLNGFYALRAAVKAGARQAGLQDADTTVTTGGLSFAGRVGPQRAEEIIQGFDPARIDAIAYHGHGPGIRAERSAYERVRGVAAKYGRADHPFIETESGYSGQTDSGLDMQSRTVVEKMVYAQSVGEPLFYYFRLFMAEEVTDGESGYSMTDHFREPHPCVFAYRHLVERLRHQTFIKTLDLGGRAGQQEIDAYAFAERDAAGQFTGRKTVVLFAESARRAEVSIRLGNAGGAATGAALFDLYGNASPVVVSSGRIVSVPVTQDPVFLTWTSPADPGGIEVAPSTLALAANEPLLENAGTVLPVRVYNPQAQPVDAVVSVTPRLRMPAQATPASLTLHLAPDASATASFTLNVGKTSQPLRLPMWWRVFTDVDMGRANLATLTAMPAGLPGTGKDAAGQFVWAPAGRLDFGKLAGSFGERRAAVACAYIDAPEAMEMPCAASADWYMAWFANGRPVYDTLAVGNKGGNLADHPFVLPLRKGRNLIVAEVLSGSGGWSLLCGGPKERAVATSGGTDPDQVLISVQPSVGSPVQLTAPVQIQSRVPALATAGSLDQPAAWMQEEPLAVLAEEAVKNLWVKEPDSSRWYQGAADLAATVWLRDGGENLQLFIAVQDDKVVAPPAPAQINQGDSVRVVLADDDGAPLADLTGAIIGGQPVLARPVEGVGFHAGSVPPGGAPVLCYRFEIRKSLVRAAAFRLNVSVLDNDAGFLKQTIDLGDVENPRQGMRLRSNDQTTEP